MKLNNRPDPYETTLTNYCKLNWPNISDLGRVQNQVKSCLMESSGHL